MRITLSSIRPLCFALNITHRATLVMDALYRSCQPELLSILWFFFLPFTHTWPDCEKWHDRVPSSPSGCQNMTHMTAKSSLEIDLNQLLCIQYTVWTDITDSLRNLDITNLEIAISYTRSWTSIYRGSEIGVRNRDFYIVYILVGL